MSVLKRFLKILPICLTVVLLGICFLFGGVRASDCTHEWSGWSGRDGQHRRECLLCGSVVTGECEYYSIVLRPTCTETGHTEKTCTICNDHFVTDETPATGHTWNEGSEILAPTCVAEGTMQFDCLYCNEQKTESIAATGEHSVVNDEAVAPTCKDTGLTEGAHCDVCGEVFIEQKTVDKLSHSWDLENTTVVKEPTCQPGLEQTQCINCSAVGQRTLSAVDEHKRFVQTIAKNVTCTTDGNTQHVICSVCETVLNQGEVIPALGHEWSVTVHTEATCTTDGSCDRYCVRCGESDIGMVIPASGHAFVTVSAKAPTCTQGGTTASRSCENCSLVLVESVGIEALGHDYELTSTRNATCTSDGGKLFDCTRCTSSYSEKINRLGHDLYIASTTDATCTTMGLILQKCSRCSHTLSQSIKPLGHEEVYTVQTPTCTEGGYTTVTCTRCEYAGQVNPTEPAGHSGEAFEVIAATCTAEGYEMHRCTACGFEYEANRQSAKGHLFGPGLVIAPTCTQDGMTKFTCLHCPEVKTEDVVPATGHSLQEAVSDGDATHSGFCSVCVQTVSQACFGGTLSCLEHAVCALCGGTYGDPAGEHSFTKITVVNDSYHRVDCANCDTVGEETEKHSFSRGEFSASACGFVYTCRTCSHTVWGRPIGDADGNGIVGDTADARTALRYSVNLDTPTDASAAAADVDRDGVVTTTDARLILRVSVGLDEKNWSVLFVTENGSLPN